MLIWAPAGLQTPQLELCWPGSDAERPARAHPSPPTSRAATACRLLSLPPCRLGRSPFSTKQRKQAAEAADAEAEGREEAEGPRLHLSGRSLPVRRGRGKRKKSEASRGAYC